MAKKSVKETITDYELIKKYLEDEARYLRSINDIEGERARNTEIIAERQRLINDLLANSGNLTKKQQEYLNALVAEQHQAVENEKVINAQLERQINRRQKLVDIGRDLTQQLKAGWQHLQQSDKVIKSTILNLGMSGVKAEMMRASFEQFLGYVSRLGGTIEDVQAIMQGYADETGKARALSAEMVKDVTLIGKGTGLGIEQATKLAAQFEFMGFDAKSTMEYVLGVVDTSERMGVNTTKVLKSVSDNFKKLTTFTFQGGVKAFAEVAQSAEKTRVSMATALNVAEATRSLDKVIDLGANLQIMGGEFAKMDPFEWLYTVRNEPDKLNAKISDMTKGIYTLRKTSDGTFERFISPADRDRLANVAKSLGISNEEMFEIAQKRLDMSVMDKQMAGMGLTKREKELLQGAAVLNKNTGKYQVMLAGEMRDINTLTKSQAQSFERESKSLEDRAKEAQTFNEAFQATINELKSTLLPLLKSVNTFLTNNRGWIIKVTEWLTKGSLGWLKAGGVLLTAATAWKLATGFLDKTLEKFVKGGVLGMLSGGGAGGGGNAAQTLAGGKAAKAAGIGGGAKALGAGVGVGAAVAGTGAGIMLTAKGFSELADSIAKLTPEQAKVLESIGKTLAITFPLAAAGIAIVAAVAAPAAVPLLALGAAALMVGGAIGIAAAGIGFMGRSLAELVKESKGTGPAMLQVGAGIAAISMSMAEFMVGAPGFLVFAATMKTLSKHAPAMAVIGSAFKEISTVMRGSREDFLAVQSAVESISKANVRGGGALSELSALLKQPLKVEFSDKNLAVISDITLNIDGQKFMQKVYRANIAVQRQVEARMGQSTG
mgnify:CR=1 FL=1